MLDWWDSRSARCCWQRILKQMRIQTGARRATGERPATDGPWSAANGTRHRLRTVALESGEPEPNAARYVSGGLPKGHAQHAATRSNL